MYVYHNVNKYTARHIFCVSAEQNPNILVSSCNKVGVYRAPVQIPQRSVESRLTKQQRKSFSPIKKNGDLNTRFLLNVIDLILLPCSGINSHYWTNCLFIWGTRWAKWHFRTTLTAMRKAIRPEVPQPLRTTRLSRGSWWRRRSFHNAADRAAQTQTERESRYLENVLHLLSNLRQCFCHLFAQKPLK